MRRRLLVLALLLAPACLPDADLAHGVPWDDGEIVALVEAGVDALAGPSLSLAGDAPIFEVHGRHPDACTRFDRFETEGFEAGALSLIPWAIRTVGPCTLGDVPFSAAVTVAGLAPGAHRVVVMPGDLSREITVLAGRAAACAGTVSLPIDALRAPPVTHPAGSAEVLAEIVLPTFCHGPPAVGVEATADGFAFAAQAPVCGPIDDAAACPAPGPRVRVRRALGPLPEGSHRLGGPEVRTTDEVAVVDVAQCAFEPLAIEGARIPALAAEDDPPRLVVEGRLPSDCAAIDPATWTISGDEVRVTVPVRTCERTEAATACVPATTKVRAEIPLTGLGPGTWRVFVNGRAVPGPMVVGRAGVCETRPLPPEAVSGVIATAGLYTDLLREGGQSGLPLDLHVVGALPDGCWASPSLRLDEDLSGGRVALRTEATFCEMACDLDESGNPDPHAGFAGAEPDEGEDDPPREDAGSGPITGGDLGARGFSAALAIPSGLSPGTWTVILDGRDEASFTVE
jgi:hypothetical protein